MLLGGVGGLEAQFAGDIRPGRRVACIGNVLPDHVEYLFLSRGELHVRVSV